MLQQLRRASKSWVASVVIGFLVLAFALWGVADIFRGGADTVVAEVGGTQISDQEFDFLMKNQMRALSQQTQQQLTMDQAKAIGLDKTVLDQAISRAALDEEGTKLGLTASQTTIANAIRANTAFRGSDGAFDPAAFARTLQDAGLSEGQFVNQTGGDIMRGQLLNAATDGIAAPPGLTRLLFDFITEQRVVEYVVVTPDEAGQVPEPSATDLEAYYKAHAQQFSAPEYRAFDYVEISPDQISGEIQVSDADIKAEYDAKKATYDKPEQRDIEQINFPDKATADAAYQKIKSGTDFAALARERGLKDEDVKLGTFTQAQMDARLAKAAFSAPQGQVAEPVQGPFGWVMLRAAKVTPGETKTFDDVKDQIKADLVKSRATAKLTDIANAFEDARGGGASIQDAAKKQGLSVQHVAAVDRQGNTPEKSKAEIPAPQVLDTAFQTESGEDSDLIQSNDGRYFALKVTQVTPAAVKPLDSVREDVKEGFIAEARAKALQTKVQTLADQAMKDGNLAAVGKSLGHAPVTSMPLARGKTDDVFSAALIGQVFAVPKGSVVTGQAGKGNGMVIARIIAVNHPEPDVSSADYVNFRRGAAQQLGGTVVDTVAQAARQKAGVNIHQATVQRVLGDTPQ